MGSACDHDHDHSGLNGGALDRALAAAEARGHIRFGTARAKATTLTCMVGDFFADRHVHFVDGDGLGFWRASVELKKKTITS